MMIMYSDPMCQRAYEAGVRDTLEELQPQEPSPEDRVWFEANVEPAGYNPTDCRFCGATLEDCSDFPNQCCSRCYHYWQKH